MSELQLGKLESVHGIAPAFLQRAVIVSMLSFIFFLAMLLVFYVRQNILYFLLSTAFLLVYLFTMFGWLLMRKNLVKIYENGLTYKKISLFWHEIESVSRNQTHYEIEKKNGEKIILPETFQDVEQIVNRINSKINSIRVE